MQRTLISIDLAQNYTSAWQGQRNKRENSPRKDRVPNSNQLLLYRLTRSINVLTHFENSHTLQCLELMGSVLPSLTNNKTDLSECPAFLIGHNYLFEVNSVGTLPPTFLFHTQTHHKPTTRSGQGVKYCPWHVILAQGGRICRGELNRHLLLRSAKGKKGFTIPKKLDSSCLLGFWIHIGFRWRVNMVRPLTAIWMAAEHCE